MRAQVQSLVGDLRSHKLYDAAEKKKKGGGRWGEECVRRKKFPSTNLPG